ncbi:MAG: zinc-binding dehydrogenase [Candidatus Gastranaerophilales bacterium]|nr:zinc-binding dehydrogenase [Candidatus Gastranaerophilales bacterium]
MNNKMKALLYYEPGVVKFEEIDIPEPEAEEVLVKVHTALTCGTDIKTYKRGHPVLIKVVPSGFGHEFAGTVAKIGNKVEGFSIGDRVVGANSAPCLECFYCKIKKYNLCENLNLLNGAYAEYIKIPNRIVRQNLLKIPDHVSYEAAAFTEPLANVVHGVERTNIQPGSTVGVVGLGPIGLMFVRLAKLKGARVIAAGRNPLKLKLAKEFGGADEVVNLLESPDPDKAIMDLTPEGKGLDVAIEAVGLPALWERVIDLTRKGGTVNLFGGCKSGTKVQLDTRRVHYDEINIISVFHHTPYHIREALRLISEGQVDVTKLITHTLPIFDIDKAIKLHDEGKAIKIAMKP